MPLNEAWSMLGKNPVQIYAYLSTFTNLQERIEAIDRLLEQAKKTARMLLAQFHPDKNPDNIAALEKFKNINQAIGSIEFHTEEFKKKAQTRLNTNNDLENDITYLSFG